MEFKKVDLKKLRKTLEMEGKKYLIYHRDSDGVCSASQIMKCFRGFIPICREGPILDDRFVRYLIKGNPKSIVFVDLPVDHHNEKLSKIMDEIPNLSMAIIDHHPHEKDMNDVGIIHINNMMEDDYKDKYIPASCIIWRILKEMGFSADDFSWVSGIGVIGDYGPKECGDVIDSVKKKTPELVKGNPMKSSLAKGSDLISASITVNGLKGADYSLKLLNKSKSFYDFASEPKLIELNEVLQSEIQRLLVLFEEEGNVIEDEKLVLFEIKSIYSISSIISTILSEKFSDYVLIIFKKWNDAFKISLRCQDGHIDVGDLAKTCSDGIGSGGGHKKAAGALVNDFDRFKKNAIEYISNQA